MQKFLGLVLLFLVSFANVAVARSASDGMSAQDRDAKASLYVGSIRRAVNIDIKEINKVGSGLAAEQAHQLDSADLIMRGFATYENEALIHNNEAKLQNEDAANQRKFAVDFNVQADSYNGVCHGTVDQSTYNWCQSERARLQPIANEVETWRQSVETWKEKIDTNKNRLDGNLGILNAASAQLNRDGNDIHQRGLKYFEKYNRLVEQVKNFSEKLAELQAGFDVCKNAQGSLERVHEICGTMFDGNIVHETETNYPVPDPTFKFYDGPTRCTPQKTFCLEAIK